MSGHRGAGYDLIVGQQTAAIRPAGAIRLGELADDLCALIGMELTAYVARAERPAQFLACQPGAAPAIGADPADGADRTDGADPTDGVPVVDRLAADRLAVLRRFAGIFRAANAATRLRAWLREVDPELGGRCPAEIIRESGDAPALLGAARRFLRRGNARR